MATPHPGIKLIIPVNSLNKPLTADFKKLTVTLIKTLGSAAVLNFGMAASNAADAIYAFTTTTPGELAFILIHGSITKALIELVGESVGERLAEARLEGDSVDEQLLSALSGKEVFIDKDFLDRPDELPVIEDIQCIVKQWLNDCGIKENDVESIVKRLPSYFGYALIQEWRKDTTRYDTIIKALDTPFSKAVERQWAWLEYGALLQRRVDECVFDETFSLSQIYVPLNAYYEDTVKDVSRPGQKIQRRVVIRLDEEIDGWLQNVDKEDAIRVISGGPGSGKSSFARMLAARLAKEGKKVLYVPLHKIDPAKDFVKEIGEFARDEGVLVQNPLEPDSPEPDLVIILDGLDELASQGKAAEKTARDFVREVEKTVERRTPRLRVLINGRELVVQENKLEFRGKRQILNLLPYYQHNKYAYHDPTGFLQNDLRDDWWKKYGSLKGNGYEAMPKELKREELDDITVQPLLNYLLVLSYTRGKLKFDQDTNLNSIYSDLVDAVYERGYEKHPYKPIRHMTGNNFISTWT
ncbi:pentapeptide repeat-containing protein [Candidatus Magnetobacterium bavaricum]|uniref:Pentapeptide repeat-containing protein n=1 Tax=Candidatus Magnetobacterium bavaricum TaxID=29290 RepID=A0A0F3GTG5_9BACT|nr:pentapeptide repeat-containing protein [Candidatus Magnetobacterium bavaricum]